MDVLEYGKGDIYNSFPPSVCKDVKDLIWLYVEGDLSIYKEWSKDLFNKVLNKHDTMKLYSRKIVIDDISYSLSKGLGITLGEFLEEKTLVDASTIFNDDNSSIQEERIKAVSKKIINRLIPRWEQDISELLSKSYDNTYKEVCKFLIGKMEEEGYTNPLFGEFYTTVGRRDYCYLPAHLHTTMMDLIANDKIDEWLLDNINLFFKYDAIRGKYPIHEIIMCRWNNVRALDYLLDVTINPFTLNIDEEGGGEGKEFNIKEKRGEEEGQGKKGQESLLGLANIFNQRDGRGFYPLDLYIIVNYSHIYKSNSNLNNNSKETGNSRCQMCHGINSQINKNKGEVQTQNVKDIRACKFEDIDSTGQRMIRIIRCTDFTQWDESCGYGCVCDFVEHLITCLTEAIGKESVHPLPVTRNRGHILHLPNTSWENNPMINNKLSIFKRYIRELVKRGLTLNEVNADGNRILDLLLNIQEMFKDIDKYYNIDVNMVESSSSFSSSPPSSLNRDRNNSSIYCRDGIRTYDLRTRDIVFPLIINILESYGAESHSKRKNKRIKRNNPTINS